MNPSPPENSAAPDAINEGGRETLDTYDAATVAQPSRRVNGIAAPPDGFAFENDQLVPVTMPPDENEEKLIDDHLEFYRRFLALVEWALDAEISPKLAAVWVVLKRDTRSPRDIAQELGVSPRLVTLRIAEAEKILKALHQEARL
jgi:DNA-directed RNA polymerase specialized sigma24 family protein